MGVDTSTWDLVLSFTVASRLFGIRFMKGCGSVCSRYGYPGTVPWGCLPSEGQLQGVGRRGQEGDK